MASALPIAPGLDPSLSPSHLARIGLGLAPVVGPPASDATSCHLCGTVISVGESAIPWRAGAGFMDEASYGGASGVLCTDCPPLLEAAVLRLGGCVVTAHGAFRLFTLSERGRFLFAPPPPPFVAVVPSGNMQHLLWRAAVTLDVDRPAVRVGERLLRFDRPRLLALAAQARSLAAYLPIPSGKSVRTMHHPFLRLRGDYGDCDLRLRREAVAAATTSALRAAVRALSCITPDDAWALAGLTYGPEADLSLPLPPARSLDATPASVAMPSSEEPE